MTQSTPVSTLILLMANPPSLIIFLENVGAPNNSNLISFVYLFIAKNVHIFKTTAKKINTVRNLITISIVFTNKNGMDRFKTRVKTPHQK